MSASDSPLLETTDGSSGPSQSTSRLAVNFKLHQILFLFVIVAAFVACKNPEMEHAFDPIEGASSTFESDLRQLVKAASALGNQFFTNQWNLFLILACAVTRLVLNDITLYTALERHEIKLGYKIKPFKIPPQADLADLDV